MIDPKADALVIRRVQPEHPLKNKRRLGKSVQPPKAEPVTVQASQKRAVVYVAPGQCAVESRRQG